MSRPSELVRGAMQPGPWVKFWRTFWLYQLWRFTVINLRFLRVIRLSHRRRPRPGERTPLPGPARPAPMLPGGAG